MEPKLKKSLVNKILTKQIFVPSISLLDQTLLSLTAKKILSFGIWLESRQPKKAGGGGIGNLFVFAKIYIITIFVILKLVMLDWKFFKGNIQIKKHMSRAVNIQL